MTELADTNSSSPEGWAPIDGDVAFLTLRISVKCEHCGQPIPINGPVKRIKCDACTETSGTRGFTGALSDARKGLKELGSPFDYRTSKDPNPECLSCGARVQFGPLLKECGPATTHACQKCGTPAVSYPVPGWLKGQFNGALQIYGGDAPGEDPSSGRSVEVATAEAKPVLMNCPGCGAGLEIGAEAQRTTTCQYCRASVFIPDALWKTLHPAKTQEFWTISYVAKKRKERKQDQTKQKRSAARRDPSPAAVPANETGKKKYVLPQLLAAVVIGALVFWIWLWGGW